MFVCLFIYLLLFFYPHLMTCSLILERGERREREGEKYQCEKHQLVVSHTSPSWGQSPQPRHVPWEGIKLTIFQFMGQYSNQLNHIGQARFSFLMSAESLITLSSTVKPPIFFVADDTILLCLKKERKFFIVALVGFLEGAK